MKSQPRNKRWVRDPACEQTKRALDLLLKHRVVTICGRNGHFGPQTSCGLLKLSCQVVLNQVSNNHRAEKGTWWQSHCTDDDLIKVLPTLGDGQHYIWTLRNYSPRDASWIKGSSSDPNVALTEALGKANAWLIDVVEIEQHFKIRQYLDNYENLIQIPWHLYLLSELEDLLHSEEISKLVDSLSGALKEPDWELRLFSALESSPGLHSKYSSDIEEELNKAINEFRIRPKTEELLRKNLSTSHMIKRTMLIVAAFAQGNKSCGVFDKLCRALLPNEPVPIAHLPQFLE